MDHPLIDDRPTLGAYLRQPGVTERIELRRAAALEAAHVGIEQMRLRIRAEQRVYEAHVACALNRPLPRVADELRTIADEIDAGLADIRAHYLTSDAA